MVISCLAQVLLGPRRLFFALAVKLRVELNWRKAISTKVKSNIFCIEPMRIQCSGIYIMVPMSTYFSNAASSRQATALQLVTPALHLGVNLRGVCVYFATLKGKKVAAVQIEAGFEHDLEVKSDTLQLAYMNYEGTS